MQYRDESALFEFSDVFGCSWIEARSFNTLTKLTRERMKGLHGTIVASYGYGVCTGRAVGIGWDGESG